VYGMYVCCVCVVCVFVVHVVCVCECLFVYFCVGSGVALQAPLSMEFSRQEYWSGFPFATLGDLPDQG